MRKIGISIRLTTIVLLAAGFCAGQEYTYTYTGATFSQFQGNGFSSGDFDSLSFTLPFSLPANLSYVCGNPGCEDLIPPSIVAWSMADGVQDFSALGLY